VIAKRKGVAVRRGLKEAWTKNASQCTRTGSEMCALGERANVNQSPRSSQIETFLGRQISRYLRSFFVVL
jgi:hypothetical protein